jgi:plastocyanin
MEESLKRFRRTLLLTIAAALVTGAAPAFATEHTDTFRMPVEVKGYQVKQEYSLADHPHVNGYITRMSVDIVDAGGKAVPINRLMLHHIVFSNVTGKPNPACNGITSWDSKTKLPNITEQFYGAGEERNKLVLPPGYGYRLDKDQPWVITWMLMNHRRVTDRAFIEWKVTYEDSAEGITPVHPYWLDIKNCNADPVFDVPGGGKRGSTFRRSYDLRMPESGRIVSGGGHVHGGARNLELTEPDCGNRKLFTSRPAWGMPSNPFYNVRPILHEPGPIAMSGFLSPQGFPIAQGQRIRLTANYDNSRLHTRVMGIEMIYVAPQTVDGCGPLPTDVTTFQTSEPHRSAPPRFSVPLTGLDDHGRAITIARPPGKTRDLGRGGTIDVRDFTFSRPNVVVNPGATVRWRFDPSTLHNLTVADGPRGFASLNLSDGRSYRKKLTKPGTYKVFCALHPVDMTGTIKVRRPRR